MMKKMCIAALLLGLTAVSATAQTITAKCKTCGKPIAACPYKGRHPAAAPGKKPARQQPSRRPGGHSGAMSPTQSQGVSGSSTRPQTTRPAVNPEKANLLNLIAKPFGVVENVSENTTPQQIRDSFPDKLYAAKGEDIFGMLRVLRATEGVKECNSFGSSCHITVAEGGPDAEALAKVLAQNGFTSCSLSPIEAGIEDCFMSLS